MGGSQGWKTKLGCRAVLSLGSSPTDGAQGVNTGLWETSAKTQKGPRWPSEKKVGNFQNRYQQYTVKKIGWRMAWTAE